MIELTRLNNRPLVVNCDLVKFIENTPDTVLTLTTGEKVVVSESSQVVIARVIEFRRRILTSPPCEQAIPEHSSGETDTAAVNDRVEG